MIPFWFGFLVVAGILGVLGGLALIFAAYDTVVSYYHHGVRATFLALGGGLLVAVSVGALAQLGVFG